jgi:hypothetical protein
MTDPAEPQPRADPLDPDAPPPSPSTGTGDGAGPSAPAGAGPAGSTSPPLRADPDRPADSGWREPPWIPGRPRERDGRPSAVAIVVGLVFIGFGAYWFLDQTLGIDMPRIAWSSVWPVILIVIGGLIVLRSLERRS